MFFMSCHFFGLLSNHSQQQLIDCYTVNISQQPVPMQPPAYWAAPSGPSPPGAVPVSYAGGTVPNQANPQVGVMVKPLMSQ